MLATAHGMRAFTECLLCVQCCPQHMEHDSERQANLRPFVALQGDRQQTIKMLSQISNVFEGKKYCVKRDSRVEGWGARSGVKP